MKDYFKKLYENMCMSADYGAAGARELANPKKSGRDRASKNQSTKVHEVHFEKDYLEELWIKQNGKCFWLGIDMSLEDLYIPHSPFAVSVDRLNSNGDYTKGNVVLTSRLANRGRGSYDNPDFQSRLNYLLENKDTHDISTLEEILG